MTLDCFALRIPMSCNANLVLEDQLAAVPSGKTNKHEAAQRQQCAPWQDGVRRIFKPNGPVGAYRGEQHHCHHRMGPAFRPTPDTGPGEQLRRSGDRRKQAHYETPAGGPNAKPEEERIRRQPPEHICAECADHKRDRKADEHGMDRMARDGNARTDVKMPGLIEFGHVMSTRVAKVGCAALSAATAGCAGPYSALEPAGPAAAGISLLWWVMLGGALLILTGVTATVLYAMRRRRRDRDWSEKTLLIGGGLIFPFFALSTLMFFAFSEGQDQFANRRSGPIFHAHADQWLWTFRYPDGQTSTGVLHVKAGETFQVDVTSGDVIHSFWVPRLGGKIDAVPGRTNRISLRADRPGAYHGQCAEYCGVGHVEMPFTVVAHSAERYSDALAQIGEREATAGFTLIERPQPSAGKVVGNIVESVLRWLGISG